MKMLSNVPAEIVSAIQTMMLPYGGIETLTGANAPQSQLVGRVELARLLDCHPGTVDRLARCGVLNKIRLSSKMVKYDVAESIQAVKAAGGAA